MGRVNVYQPNAALYRDALNSIRTASLNCYSFEVGTLSQLAEHSQAGAQVCFTWPGYGELSNKLQG